jgi:hypothetical protein
MRRNFLMLLCLFFLLVLPNVVSADCMKVGSFDNFIVKDGSTIMLYNGSVPIVKIEVDCTVLPTSTIRLLKEYLCDDDEILIDGSTCNIESLE